MSQLLARRWTLETLDPALKLLLLLFLLQVKPPDAYEVHSTNRVVSTAGPDSLHCDSNHRESQVHIYRVRFVFIGINLETVNGSAICPMQTRHEVTYVRLG